MLPGDAIELEAKIKVVRSSVSRGMGSNGVDLELNEWQWKYIEIEANFLIKTEFV